MIEKLEVYKRFAIVVYNFTNLPLNCFKFDGLKKFIFEYILDSSYGTLVGFNFTDGGNNNHDFLY